MGWQIVQDSRFSFSLIGQWNQILLDSTFQKIVINRSLLTSKVVAIRPIRPGEVLKGLRSYRAQLSPLEERYLNERRQIPDINLHINSSRLESNVMFAYFCLPGRFTWGRPAS